MIRAIALSLLLACGGSAIQRATTTTARVSLVDTMEARVSYYHRRDAECRDQLPPADHQLSEWRECMRPAYRLQRSVHVLDRVFRATQAAIDAEGEDGFRAALPDLVFAARQVAHAFSAAGLDVPPEVDGILSLVRFLPGGEQ